MLKLQLKTPEVRKLSKVLFRWISAFFTLILLTETVCEDKNILKRRVCVVSHNVRGTWPIQPVCVSHTCGYCSCCSLAGSALCKLRLHRGHDDSSSLGGTWGGPRAQGAAVRGVRVMRVMYRHTADHVGSLICPRAARENQKSRVAVIFGVFTCCGVCRTRVWF